MTARTLNLRDIARENRRYERQAGPLPVIPPYVRPATRGDCVALPRPCPFVGCRYHLAMDVAPHGALTFGLGADTPLESMGATCALDVAADGARNLDEIGTLIGVTRERVRQLEERALAKLAAYATEHDLDPGNLTLPGLETVAAVDSIEETLTLFGLKDETAWLKKILSP